MLRPESTICQEILAATPLGTSLSQVRAFVAERYTESALFPPTERTLTAGEPQGPGSFQYPEARLVLKACVERDPQSEPPSHVAIHWVFDSSDVLVGLASRRQTDDAQGERAI